MTDLVSRLLEAITETERRARDAQHPDAPYDGERWQWEYTEQECPLVDTPADLDATETYLGDDVGFGWRVSLRSAERYQRLPEGHPIGGPELPHMAIPTAEEVPVGVARHIVHNDPSSVLRRCAADRKLVDLHSSMWIRPGHPYFNDEHLTREPMTLCKTCEPEGMWRREKSWPCRTILTLAEAYGLEVTE